MSSPTPPTPAAPPPATCRCTRSARTPGCWTRNASCSPTPAGWPPTTPSPPWPGCCARTTPGPTTRPARCCARRSPSPATCTSPGTPCTSGSIPPPPPPQPRAARPLPAAHGDRNPLPRHQPDHQLQRQRPTRHPTLHDLTRHVRSSGATERDAAAASSAALTSPPASALAASLLHATPIRTAAGRAWLSSTRASRTAAVRIGVACNKLAAKALAGGEVSAAELAAAAEAASRSVARVEVAARWFTGGWREAGWRERGWRERGRRGGAGVIRRVFHGRSPYGLVRYLYGEGRRNEHTEPHLIASWDDDPAGLEPAFVAALDRPDVAPLVRTLARPVGGCDRAPQQWVYHLVLRNDAAARQTCAHSSSDSRRSAASLRSTRWYTHCWGARSQPPTGRARVRTSGATSGRSSAATNAGSSPAGSSSQDAIRCGSVCSLRRPSP